MWQKCPICNGIGKSEERLGYYKVEPDCPICRGKGIISELTGLPPNDFVNNSCDVKTNQSTDFRDGNMESQQDYFGK